MRDNSVPAFFVPGLVVAFYLWLTLFPRRCAEEAIGSCIGLIAGVLAIYGSKLGIIFALIAPSVARTWFGYGNLFLLGTAIAVWALNFRNLQNLRLVSAMFAALGVEALSVILLLNSR
jgi:hypothetical protein